MQAPVCGTDRGLDSDGGFVVVVLDVVPLVVFSLASPP